MSFNKDLLSMPMPKFHDDCEVLWRVYQNIKQELWRWENHPKFLEKCKKLEEGFLELYGRAKTKEEIKSKDRENKTQKPFYYVSVSDRLHNEIFRRLRYRRKTI
jgi:hypothetical protein